MSNTIHTLSLKKFWVILIRTAFFWATALLSTVWGRSVLGEKTPQIEGKKDYRATNCNNLHCTWIKGCVYSSDSFSWLYLLLLCVQVSTARSWAAELDQGLLKNCLIVASHSLKWAFISSFLIFQQQQEAILNSKRMNSLMLPLQTELSL